MLSYVASRITSDLSIIQLPEGRLLSQQLPLVIIRHV
jgi:hypothetical protein